MSIVVSDVVTDFGAFYKPGSDNQKTLRNMLYKTVETAKYFQPRVTEDTIWRGTLATLTRIVQPFQKAFTPIGTLTFKPNKFDLFKIKIDLKETPDDLEASYLGFLTSIEEIERAKWPFVRWWMEQQVMPKKDEDLEVNEYFSGVYAAPTPGTAGPVSTAMNGLRKVIRDYNTASRLNLGNGPISMGEPAGDDVDFCTQVEEYAEDIPTHFRSKIDFIFMSKDNELRYKRGRRAKYKGHFNFIDRQELNIVEDFQNMKIVGLESHQGSNMIWSTIPENRINPKKKASLKDTMLVKEFSPREVSAYTDWWEALNFEVPEFLFTNDQDLA